MLTAYYLKYKENRSKKARDRYQNHSEEEKVKKHLYASERFRYLSEEEKVEKHQHGPELYKKVLEDEQQRLVEYINNNSIM